MNNKVNSLEYWNKRFEENWEIHNGRDQSRFFSKVAIRNLPDWFVREINSKKLSITDWGCALGDGTDVIKSYFPNSCIVGIDFAQSAIANAIKSYPSIEFRCEDWISNEIAELKSFDIVFSSNVLEHFYDWKAILRKLSSRSEKAIVLALPFREEHRDLEHFVSFYEPSFSLILERDFVLAWARVIDCRDIEDTHWHGEQIILIYARSDWLDTLNLTLDECEYLLGDINCNLSSNKNYDEFFKDILKEKERFIENERQWHNRISQINLLFAQEKASFIEKIQGLKVNRSELIRRLENLESELANY